MFYRDGGLYAVPFDAGRLTVTGQPMEVTAAVEQDASGAPLAELSSAGSLVYQRAGRDIRAAGVGLASRRRATRDRYAARISEPASVGRQRSDRGRCRERPLDSGHASFDVHAADVATRARPRRIPVWTPDGKQVVFRTPTGLRSIDTDGSGRSRAIAGTTSDDFPSTVSPDGGTLASCTKHCLITPPTSTRSRSPATASHGRSSRVRPSRAARSFPQMAAGWLTCRTSRASFRSTYGAIRVPRADGRCQRTAARLHSGIATGNELFYRGGNKMMAVAVTTTPEVALAAPRMHLRAALQRTAAPLP